MGRRSETDLRLPGADISRVHAEITLDSGACIDPRQAVAVRHVRQRRADDRARCSRTAITIRLGQAGDTEIVFFVDDEAPSVEQQRDFRGDRAAADGRAARRAARARIGPRARRSAGAGARLGDRGDRRRTRLHHARQPREAARVQARARARQRSRCRAAPSRRAARFRRTSSRPASRRSSRTCSTATSRSCTPAPSRSASATCCARRCAWCATSSAPSRRAPKKSSACCISTAASAVRSDRRRAVAALDTLSAEAALAIENARLYREALDKAKFEQELKVAAAIQQALLPPANRDGPFFSTAAASVACRAVGGDFYDYVDLPAGGFGFIVGDVAGKARRPRCWRRPSSACSAPRPPIRRAPRR